jgi:hypothetical protein
MTPERKAMINGHLIEEIYWAGRYVVYVDHRLTVEDYDIAAAMLERGETPTPKNA